MKKGRKPSVKTPLDCDWEVLDAMVRTGIISLTEKQRTVAYLRAKGFSFVEIGEGMGQSYQSVRWHLKGIHTKYRKALEDGYTLVSGH